MHFETIKYCLENQIKHVADGNNLAQAGHALEQREDFISEIKEVYRKYGITYFCPLYNEFKVDNAEKRGFIKSLLKRSELINYKKNEEDYFIREGFTRGITIGQQHRSIQPQCFFALLLNLTRLLLSLIKEENTKAHLSYLRSKISILENMIGRQGNPSSA